MAEIKIDGKEYKLEDLSEDAKASIVSIQVCDNKLRELNQEIAMIKTARNAYAKTLSEQLKEKTTTKSRKTTKTPVKK